MRIPILYIRTGVLNLFSHKILITLVNKQTNKQMRGVERKNKQNE